MTTRRGFLRVSAAVAGGLIIAVRRAKGAFEPSAFVRIDPDGTVVICSKQPEIGQGIKTALPMIVAEEMDADWSRVRVEQGDLDPKRYGGQGSGGSDNVTSEWETMREAGAMARVLLIGAAARRWSVPESECTTRDGQVSHTGTGRKLNYGDLAADAAQIKPPAGKPPLKAPADFRLIGTRARVIDAPEIATGKATYGLDVKRDDMLHAVIEKCPVFNGKVKSVDDAETRALAGVRDVIVIDGMENPTHLMPGVAVLADSTWIAMQARKKLKVTWDEGPGASESTGGLRQRAEDVSKGPGKVLAHVGDVDEAIGRAAVKLEAQYEVPFLAHACMEPVNCVADVREDRCEVWGPMQQPGSARALIARRLRIPPANITVHMTRIGGGFGRRLLSDYAVEAAVLSQKARRPVQVVWTREDDFQHDYYRPMGVHFLRAGLDSASKLIAWDHHAITTSRNAYRRDNRGPEATEIYGLYTGNGTGLKEQISSMLLPTLIPNIRARYSELKTTVPTGAWRAPSHNAHGFIIESFLDEVAHAGKRDPIDLRLEFLGSAQDFPFRSEDNPQYDPGRMKTVLELAAEKSGWGRKPPSGIARGIACHFTFGSYAAEVAEVSVDEKNRLRVHRVVVALDCGTVVNRWGVEAQAEGGVLDGLNAALFGEMTIADGRARKSTFSDYRMLRIGEAPDVEVHIVASKERPTGFGEIALPPCAGAVVNAIFAATGKRVRRLPMVTAGFTV
jgi:isoquinoline 1-oxidoreductase beta subunit